MDTLERFFNVQNDWTWGPFESFRPAQDCSYNSKRVIHILYFLYFLGSIVTLTLITMTQNGVHSFVSWQSVIGWLIYTCRISGLEIAIGGILVAVFAWPYVYFWNRRAARLRQAAPITEENVPIEGVWPPPPKRG